MFWQINKLWRVDRIKKLQFSSVQFSRSVVSDSLWPHESQHPGPPSPSPSPRVHSKSSPSSWWCHPAISSSVIPFSSCLQSLPASESFPMSQLFSWDGQSAVVSALASFLPKNTQDWSLLEWTGWISLQSKSLLQHHSTKVSILQCSAFFAVQLSHPSNQWCHPAISSSVIPFSSCLQSLPASESFPVSQLFAWGGQSTGVSALAYLWLLLDKNYFFVNLDTPPKCWNVPDSLSYFPSFCQQKKNFISLFGFIFFGYVWKWWLF